MKFSVIILTLLALNPAFAAATDTPLLTITSDNGPVAPTYHTSTTCKIYPNQIVIQKIVGSIVRPNLTTKAVIWTSAVPNSQTIVNLVNATEPADIYKVHPPLGCGMTVYSAMKDGLDDSKSMVIFAICGNTITKESHSNSAKILKNFMDSNCFHPAPGGAVSGNN